MTETQWGTCVFKCQKSIFYFSSHYSHALILGSLINRFFKIMIQQAEKFAFSWTELFLWQTSPWVRSPVPYPLDVFSPHLRLWPKHVRWGSLGLIFTQILGPNHLPILYLSQNVPPRPASVSHHLIFPRKQELRKLPILMYLIRTFFIYIFNLVFKKQTNKSSLHRS